MRTLLLAILIAAAAVPAWTQTADELVNDGKNPANVTTQSMGYDRKSYSPLRQINKNNVKRLVPVWSTSLMNDMGELAAPTIYNGVTYVINGKWSFDENGDTTLETMSGYKVVKADTPLGCKFEFETILE